MAIFQTENILFIPQAYTEYPKDIRDDIYRVGENIHNSKLYTLLNVISLFLLGVHSISSNLLPELSLYTELSMLAGLHMFLCIMFYSEREYTIPVLKELLSRNYSKTSVHSTVLSLSVLLLCYAALLFIISFETQHLSSMFIYLSCIIGFLLHLSLQEIHTETTDALSKLLTIQDISRLQTQYILTEDGLIHTVDKCSFEKKGIMKKMYLHTSKLEDID